MSWLEKGFSSLKGQISNFTKEVLAEDDSGDAPPLEQREDGRTVDGTGTSVESEGLFGQALGRLPLAQLSLFGRGDKDEPEPEPEHQKEQFREQERARLLLEAAVKSDLELPRTSGSGSGSPSGSGDSPQLSGVEDIGISPALSEDGFTKLDPSETELWEATQELSQTLEVNKKDIESFHQMRREWLSEKAGLENTVQNLQMQLQALQDWQTPDQDIQNGNESTDLTQQRQMEELIKERRENSDLIASLKSQLMEAAEENSELRTGMEELDSQHQAATERLIQIKNDIQKKYEGLSKEHETVNNLLKSERERLNIFEKENIDTKNKLAALEQKSESLEKICESLKENIVSLEAENDILQKDVSSVQSDSHDKLAEENNALKLQLLSVQSQNSDLMSKLDSLQLDFESLEVKLSTVLYENETLKTKLSAVQCDLQSATSEIEDKPNESLNKTDEQTSIERYIVDKLKTIVSLEIPIEYCKDIARRDDALEKELELEDQLDTVAALVKMTIDLKWKKDTLERNLLDYNRQLRDMTTQLNARDKRIAKLEEESVLLRENMESLLDGLNVAPEKGMLPSIPETPEAGDEDIADMGPIQEEEEEDDFEERVQSAGAEAGGGGELSFVATIRRLERELGVLREARSNFERESERLRNELLDLTSRLRSSESMLRNQDNLEREVSRWREKFDRLRAAHRDLQDEKDSLKEEADLARFGQDSLQAEVSEWKTVADTANQERMDAVHARDALLTEISRLKCDLEASSCINEELQNAVEAKFLLEQEVKNSVAALAVSNKSLDEANANIRQVETEITRLKELNTLNEDKRIELEIKMKELVDQVSTLRNEKLILNNSILKLQEGLQEATANKTDLIQQVSLWQDKYEKIFADMDNKAKSDSTNSLQLLHEKQNVSDLQETCKELLSSKLSLESAVSNLKTKMDDEVQKYQHLVVDLEGRITSLEEEKCALEVKLQSLQDKAEESKSALSAAAESPSRDVEALERRLRSMLDEKEQMLSVLTEKSRENGILRSENQKLVSAISSRQEEAQLLANSEQIIAQLQQEKEQLIATVQVKHNESVQYHSEILRLSALLNQQQSVGQSPVPLEQSSSGPRINSSDCVGEKSAEAQALEEKCAALASSLQQERVQNSYLQNEMQEQHEKEGVLTKELERLRLHLIDVEETHTAETLRLEELVQELQGKLGSAEERLRSISTVHTSASIRANQHVESLQGQSRLIAQQRDELQAKLSAAEDREQKNAAALRNLQAVLEQFQKDKERELGSLTEKLRIDLQVARNKHYELSQEIQGLQDKLAEAKEGLSAAARLGEQLDKKSETISILKEQIKQLQEQLKAAEGRVQGVEGKVDKSLVKNLVVGLLTAPANTRSPALRAVASVLDFSREERQRVGLEHGLNQHNEQSLSEAFVRFLESESRPQMQFRLLPEASANVNSRTGSRKESLENTSTTGDSPVRRSPLLSEVVLPTLAPLPVGRSSSSILKDVLKRSDNL